MADKGTFVLPPLDDFGIENTEVVDQVSSFLGSDPDDVTDIDEEEEKKKKEAAKVKQVTKKPLVKKQEEDDEEGKEEKKEVKMELSPDEAFTMMDPDEEDEEEEQIDEADIAGKAKKPEDTIYSSLSKELLNLGVFTTDEDEEGNEVTPDVKDGNQFLDRFRVETQKQASDIIDKFLGRFGEDYREMFDAVFVNGVPPSDYVSKQSKIQGIKDLDISSEENQEKIVRQWYRSQDRSPESIESRIQKLKNYAELSDEATEAKRVLVVKEEKELADSAIQRRQDVDRRNQIKNEYLTSVNKILQEKLKSKDYDSIPVDKKFAESTYAYLTQDRYQTADKQVLTEFDKDILDLNRPQNHGLKIKLAMLMQLLKVDPTLSRLAKKAVSNESNQVFADLEKKFGKKKTTTQKDEDTTTSNW